MSSNEQDELPNYMLPNFASILPEYSNVEADQIRNAFSVGNFQSLTKIPNKLGPNQVWKARQSQIDQNREKTFTPKIVTSCGLFSQFEYIPTRYSVAEELDATERMESYAKRLEIGGKEFICSSDTRKLKYQDGFEDKTSYPYQSDPFEIAHDQELREKWISNKKILHGPFVSAAKRNTLDIPTRKLLPDLLKDIQQVIKRDWEDYVFEVKLTDDENIALRFDVISVDSERGLMAYMNVFARTHAIMSKYSLRKVVDDWNAKPGDGGLYFVFRPPWI